MSSTTTTQLPVGDCGSSLEGRSQLPKLCASCQHMGDCKPSERMTPPSNVVMPRDVSPRVMRTGNGSYAANTWHGF